MGVNGSEGTQELESLCGGGEVGTGKPGEDVGLCNRYKCIGCTASVPGREPVCEYVCGESRWERVSWKKQEGKIQIINSNINIECSQSTYSGPSADTQNPISFFKCPVEVVLCRSR